MSGILSCAINLEGDFLPCMHCCYYNSKGIAMDLSEMRKSLIKSEKIQIPFCPVERKKMILDYWTKNIFRFRCLDNYCFGFIGRAKKIIYICIQMGIL